MDEITDIQQLISYSVQDYQENPELFTRLNSHHQRVFRTTICCLPQLESAINSLRTYINNKKPTKMSQSKYKLKPESLLYSTVSEKFYTNQTLTDNDALFLLKNAPSLIEQFDEYPDNWKEESEAFNFDDVIADIQAEAEGLPAPKRGRPKKVTE